MPKVSVIIPVYNTEKYLRKCLESVCNQTLSDIEIICIDDCSTDNSLNILKEYAQRDRRIKLIKFEENKGPAVARNLGITEASGEYIAFLDSDDYIDLDFYEKLYTKASETSAEVVKGADIKLCYGDGRIEVDEQNFKIRRNKINFWCQYTTAIYEREFIIKNEIDFPEGLLVGEDPVFTIKAAILANKVEVIDNVQYYYVRHEGSLNSDYWNSEKVESYINYINAFVQVSQKYNFDENSWDEFYNRLLADVYWTRKRKTTLYGKDYRRLTKLYERIRKFSLRNRKIKLLFDASIIFQGYLDNSAKRGIYWVSYNLAKMFLNDERFDMSFITEAFGNNNFIKDDPYFSKVKVVNKNFYLGAGANYKIVPNKNFKMHDYDIYFNPTHNDNLIVDFKPLRAYFLHDAMPMLKYDWFGDEHKDFFAKFYQNLNQDDYCFCTSQDCKNEFLRFFDKLDENKLIIAYNSTCQKLVPKYNLDKLKEILLNKYNVTFSKNNQYIFYMGAVDDSRKNLIFTIECFLKFIQKYNIKNLYFYLGGSGKEKLCETLAIRLGNLYLDNAKYIVPLGFVDEEDVNILYSNSLFFSFLSLYEGFGMPPLEAMQAGTPVVCADNSSLPEVVGDAAILVDAEDEDGIIEAFRVMYFDETKRNEYIKKGLERAKLFSWDKTYKIISDKMIEIISGKKDV